MCAIVFFEKSVTFWENSYLHVAKLDKSYLLPSKGYYVRGNVQSRPQISRAQPAARRGFVCRALYTLQDFVDPAAVRECR